MTDRGPYGSDPEPTEAFPPLRDASPPPPPPPSDLPPIGADRDPDPTRVMPPTESGIPTTALPATGGPYDPGPPFGGPPGGGDEPPFEPEPEPWYRQPGPLAALIAGIAAVIVGIIALVVWSGDDDGAISGDTLPTLVSTSSTTTTAPTTVPPTTSTTTTLPATTTSTSSTTTTSTTTTTTTVPETTTTVAETTTTATPTTTTTPPPPPPPPPPPTTAPGQGLLDEIGANSNLSTFAAALQCTGLDQDVLSGSARTVLAPSNDVFTEAGLDPCADVDATQPILLLHLVSVDLDPQAVFGADTLQTLGGRVDVNRTSQEIGTNGAQITDSVQAADGWVHTIDGIIS